MCTNLATLRNQGSGNTMVRVILGIPTSQWQPLCSLLFGPVLKTAHAGKNLIGLLLCVCMCESVSDGVDDIQKCTGRKMSMHSLTCPAAVTPSITFLFLL